MEPQKKRPGEFEVIGRYFAPLAADFPGALDLTDDAALVRHGEGRELTVTTDALVAGVHFLPDDPPADIAAKALRVNLSDLASMGAEPLAYTLALALTADIDEDWLAAFSAALGADQRQFGIGLAGGDTVSTPGPLSLTVCAFGTVPVGKALKRSAARPGDAVFVSGNIGDGALGLAVLKGELFGLSGEASAALVERYRRPQPRCTLGPRLIGVARAAIDVSDGLVADLGHICEVSGVSAAIEADRVPLSAAAREALSRDSGLLTRILGGGDDYEILFTADPAEEGGIDAAAAAAGVAVTRIGTIGEGGEGIVSSVAVMGTGDLPFDPEAGGFRHF